MPSTSDRAARPEELETYELYLLGRHHLNTNTGTGRALAAQYFERAIESDPAFARAYAGLANIYAQRARRSTTNQEALRKAQTAAEYALRLDDQSAPAYYALGEINFVKRNYSDAESAFAKAIELNPSDAKAYSRLVDTYDMQGKLSDSYQVIKRALDVNPMSGEISTKMGNVQYALSGWDWGSAFNYYQQAMENDPDYPLSYHTVGMYYSSIGQLDRALPYAKKYYSLNEDPRWAGWFLTSLYRDLGDYDSAMNLVRRMQDVYPEGFLSATLDIHVKLARGEFSTAREVIHNTLSMHFDNDMVTGVMAIFELTVGDTAHAEDIYAHLAAAPGTPNFIDEVNLYRVGTLGFGTLGAINLAYLHRRNGEPLAADELLRKARDFIESKKNTTFLFPGYANPLYAPGIAYATAQIAAVEGNKEIAVNRFREAVDAGWSKAWFARIDPIMADLREDPRFVDILEDLEERLSKMRQNEIVLAEN